METLHSAGTTTRKSSNRKTGFAAYAKASLVAGAAAAPTAALADFSGAYSVNPPVNGTYNDAAASSTFGSWTGSWNNVWHISLTTGGPSTVTMATTFNSAGSLDTYTFLVTAAASGMVSFDYTAVINNGSAPTLVDFVDQTTSTTTALSSGINSFSASVNAGDIFGFSLQTSYRGSASLTISNFSAPTPPTGNGVSDRGSTLALLASGFVGLLAYRIAALRRAAVCA